MLKLVSWTLQCISIETARQMPLAVSYMYMYIHVQSCIGMCNSTVRMGVSYIKTLLVSQGTSCGRVCLVRLNSSIAYLCTVMCTCTVVDMLVIVYIACVRSLCLLLRAV